MNIETRKIFEEVCKDCGYPQVCPALLDKEGFSETVITAGAATILKMVNHYGCSLPHQGYNKEALLKILTTLRAHGREILEPFVVITKETDEYDKLVQWFDDLLAVQKEVIEAMKHIH